MQASMFTKLLPETVCRVVIVGHLLDLGSKDYCGKKKEMSSCLKVYSGFRSESLLTYVLTRKDLRERDTMTEKETKI